MAEEAKEQASEELGEEIGVVTHYFSKIGVAVLKLEKSGLKVGDKIRIKGATTDFEQEVKSMQIEHENVQTAKVGDSIGIKIKDHVRDHDKVYKVTA